MPRKRRTAPEPERCFGTPATSPEGAFWRFGHLCHWAVYERNVEEWSEALALTVLRGMPRAEQRLVVAFVETLTGGGCGFAEAHAAWTASANDTVRLDWEDSAAYLAFLVRVRDAVDPYAWPATRPRFCDDRAGRGRP
ncbi:hypothetical protein [Methylobacterium oxalidis]|uniref:hypothetical protein n=1 Tax=Methylobacterium oxalidis TaxID=944322 RepID=UPI0033157A97